MTTIQDYILGYGSLVETRGLGMLVTVRGYERGWTARWKKGGCPCTFLNVRPNRNAKINAVAFSVTNDRMNELDKREEVYKRVEVNSTHLTPLPARNARYWIYVGDEWRPREQGAFPIRLSYLDRVVKGFDMRGGKEKFFETTSDLPGEFTNSIGDQVFYLNKEDIIQRYEYSNLNS